MIRAIIRTTSGITANLKATHIEKNGDFIEIYCGDKLHGMFDIGVIQYLYLSKSKSKGVNSDEL